jgi:hypothetical protein
MELKRLLELAGVEQVTESKWPKMNRKKMIDLILEEVQESDWAPEELVELILKEIPDNLIKTILEKHFVSSLEYHYGDDDE